MINIDVNILSKLKGKYFHKSILCITIAVVIIVVILALLIIFFTEKVTKFIQVL